MEYLDILGEEGQLTGVSRSREEVHQKGLWHMIVHIWIVNSKGEVLIQKRAVQKKTYANMWAMSCEGHVSAGETVEKAVLKELEEELGLAVSADDVEFLYGYKRKSITNNGTYFGNHFINVYLIKRDFSITDLRLQEDEVAAAKWISIDQLEKIVIAKDPTFRDYPGEYPGIFEMLRG